MKNDHILIGMSGGVDSSAAVHLLLAQGCACTGATLQLQGHACGGSDDARDAREVARRLGIEHLLLEARDLFAQRVMEPFVAAYEQGLTPNPCIQCNRHLKFGYLLDWALENGFTHVATGHYAQLRQDPAAGRFLLYRAADPAKDQTYFLASLNQHQLSHACFPLGGLTKAQVRELAAEAGLLTARKRDSQDICFIPDGDYAAFLARHTGKTYPQGDFLDLHGNTVGRHRGAVCYTLGQRKGLGLAMGQPVYVCGKDMAANTVTVGPNDALCSSALLAGNWNWFPFSQLTESLEVTAKIRHSRQEHAATVIPLKDGFAQVRFREPQRAVTPGQAVVLYQGELVIGGGTITQAL